MEENKNLTNLAAGSIMDVATQEITPEMENKVSNLGVAMGSYRDAKNFTMPKITRPLVRKHKKVYPNDPCPCGSGKKYKKCCRDAGTYEGYEMK